MKHQQAGFTLIELVVVIVLLGILAAAISPRFQDVTTNARANVAEAAAASVEAAALISFAASNGVPVSGASVAAEVAFDNAAQIQGGLVCNAAGGGDTAFTVELTESDGVTPLVPAVTATGSIPNEICNN